MSHFAQRPKGVGYGAAALKLVRGGSGQEAPNITMATRVMRSKMTFPFRSIESRAKFVRISWRMNTSRIGLRRPTLPPVHQAGEPFLQIEQCPVT